MHIRSITRWTLALLLTFAALIVTLAALNHPAAQAQRLNSIIPCSGSIQACIDSAIDGDTIVIAAGDYTESLTLNKAVSLTGVSRDTTIIHAMPNNRVLTVTGSTISNSVAISGLTLTGGDLSSDLGYLISFGGGILIINGAQPKLTHLNLTYNHARWGGGIFIYDGQLDLSYTNIIDNVAEMYGGGVSMFGAAHITDSRFEGNQALSDNGGGLHILGSAVLTNVIITVNSAYREGGGLNVSGPTRVTNGIFETNSAIYGGGIIAHDALEIIHTRFINNHAGWSGGGILVYGPFNGWGSIFAQNTADGYGGGAMTAGNVSLTQSIFIGNSSTRGGSGLLLGSGNDNQIALDNILFAKNAAQYQGATIYLVGASCLYCVPSHLRVMHTTIADPTLAGSSGIYVEDGTATITDTIIANHAIAISNTGATVYEDYNLFYGNLTNTVGSIITGGHSLVGDPKFVDPANDDYHLGFGSAAIDTGVDVGIYTDLDGNPRPKNFGFDMGAYEYQAAIYRWYFPIIYKH
jgi:hypothetical protein